MKQNIKNNDRAKQQRLIKNKKAKWSKIKFLMRKMKNKQKRFNIEANMNKKLKLKK